MILINTLEDTSLNELTHVFNYSFSDYIVKLQFSEEQMIQKIKSENIQLSLSYGAFANNKLIGFILHAMDYNLPGCVYNAGTGVVPTYRGQRLIEKLYDQAIIKLLKKGLFKHQLEVAVQNEKAFKVYRKAGFTVDRELICYKGKIKKDHQTNYDVVELNYICSNDLIEYFDFKPTWQNDFPTIIRMLDRLTIYGVKVDKIIAGFCIFNKESGRIYQISVKASYRNKGIARRLFNEISTNIKTKEVSIINIDKSNFAMHNFLLSMGIKPFLDQFEMKFNAKYI